MAKKVVSNQQALSSKEGGSGRASRSQTRVRSPEAHRIEELHTEVGTVRAAIWEHEREIENLNARLSDIRKELNNIEFSRGGSGSRRVAEGKKLGRPKAGLVLAMIEVMRPDRPMTAKEISDALSKKMGGNFEENSVRSYLSNFDCFESIKKGDPRYDRKGWICRKDII